MKKILSLFVLAGTVALSNARAGLITAVPGPDDQGGMLMPMVSITGTDDPMDPTSGNITISFSPASTPLLSSLEQWSPGDWFADTAGWRVDLGSPAGVGGTPPANAGNGDLFNNQYGFMFMAMPMMGSANIPTGKSLAIKLTAASSSLLESYNYVNAQNRWDQVFPTVGTQVLWNGSMWHNYFTLPSSALPGTYSATFEIFIANQTFTSGTGFADYTPSALAATPDGSFTPASVNYTWQVVPEPSALGLLAVVALGLPALLRKRRSTGV